VCLWYADPMLSIADCGKWWIELRGNIESCIVVEINQLYVENKLSCRQIKNKLYNNWHNINSKVQLFNTKY